VEHHNNGIEALFPNPNVCSNHSQKACSSELSCYNVVFSGGVIFQLSKNAGGTAIWAFP